MKWSEPPGLASQREALQVEGMEQTLRNRVWWWVCDIFTFEPDKVTSGAWRIVANLNPYPVHHAPLAKDVAKRNNLG